MFLIDFQDGLILISWDNMDINHFVRLCIPQGLWSIPAKTKLPVSETRKKNGFIAATKIRDNKSIFVAATKIFPAATKRFVDRTKHFVGVTKYFCYPYFKKWFCWYNRTFSTVECNVCFGCKTKTGVPISVIFRDTFMFNHIIQKISARPFLWCSWT